MIRLLFIIYTVALLVFSGWSYLYVDWHLELLPFVWYQNLQKVLWDFSLSQRITSVSIYILIILLLYTFYFISLDFARDRLLLFNKQKQFDINKIVLLIGLTIGILFFSHPALSHDIFNYIMTAKIVTFYQENPWVVMPIEFLGEPMLNFLHAGNKIVLYGPAWITISLLPSFLGQNIFLLTFLLFKLLIIGFYLALLKIIYLINNELHYTYSSNSNTLFNLVFFAFNPLVFIETLSSSHNDVAMMFFTLLSLYLLMRKKFLLSVICYLLSVGIKYATVILFPLYMLILYKMWRGKTIDWQKVFFQASILMFIVFLLSPLREELYPWYLIWPLSFLAVLDGYRRLKILIVALSLGLLLRYVPFMLTFSWFGYTPLIKTIVTLTPLLLLLVIYYVSRLFSFSR